jgi:hypothetical protein
LICHIIPPLSWGLKKKKKKKMQERVRTRKEEIGWDFPVSEAEST